MPTPNFIATVTDGKVYPKHSIYTGQKILTTSSSNERIIPGTTPPNYFKSVTIVALGDNSANILIGNSTITDSTGFVLKPGDGISLSEPHVVLSDIYIRGTMGDGITWLGVI
jgi:hypothetical protein